jgi:hypothetical protein
VPKLRMYGVINWASPYALLVRRLIDYKGNLRIIFTFLKTQLLKHILGAKGLVHNRPKLMSVWTLICELRNKLWFCWLTNLLFITSDVTPYTLADIYWRFGGKYSFHLRSWIISPESKQSIRRLRPLHACLLAGFTVWSWRQMHYIPYQTILCHILEGLLFIFIAVRTPNP